MTYAGALFDLDGLLVDSERAIRDLWQAEAHRFGLALTDDDYAPVIGARADESDRVLQSLFGADRFMSARAAVATLLADHDPGDLFPAKPGAESVLEYLRGRRVPCAVASSTSTVEVRRRLDGAGLTSYFEVVVGGDAVQRGKPDPAIYLEAARRIGREPRQCLAFEDSDHGVAAAHAAHIDVVLVPDLLRPSSESRRQCLVEVESLAALSSRLASWF